MIEIDQCHLDLLAGLIKCQKPKKVAELGFGSGKSVKTLLDALEYNTNDYDYTLVENWIDWKGKPQLDKLEFMKDYKNVKIVCANEIDFVFNTPDTYDFILSDADHWNADKWFDYVYSRLLNPGGILVYHDVSLGPEKVDLYFKNLDNIYHRCNELGLNYVHYNKSTRDDEKCERGLLLIFKSKQ
jgi:predicted O-methyltransferase YrrM